MSKKESKIGRKSKNEKRKEEKWKQKEEGKEQKKEGKIIWRRLKEGVFNDLKNNSIISSKYDEYVRLYLNVWP